MENENVNATDAEDFLTRLPWNIRLGLFYADDVDDSIVESIPESVMKAVRWAPAFSSAAVAGLAATMLVTKTRTPLTYSLRGRVKRSMSPRWSAFLFTAAAAGTFAASLTRSQIASFFSSPSSTHAHAFPDLSHLFNDENFSTTAIESSETGSSANIYSLDSQEYHREQHHERRSGFSYGDSLQEAINNAAFHEKDYVSVEGETRRAIINQNAALTALNLSCVATQLLALRQKNGKVSIPSAIALTMASIAVEPLLHFVVTRAGLKKVVDNFMPTQHYSPASPEL